MTGNEFNISNNVSGGAQQQNIGQSGGEAIQNVHQETSVSFEDFARQVESLIADDKRSEVAAALDPLREIAASEPPDDEESKRSLLDRIGEYAGRLAPYAPQIKYVVSKFTKGALESLPPPAGWIVSGILKVIDSGH